MKKELLYEQYEPLHGALVQLNKYIYDNPELGNEEFKAVAAHKALLTEHGFTFTESYLGIPTAFRADYDSGKPGPAIGFLAEYDALPGMGHGCGHNMVGTTATGAGILLSKVIDDIGGRVIVYGTPAEETVGGKVLMTELGAFDDCDITLSSHPYDDDVESGSSLAEEDLQFVFLGKPSHAAAAPEQGINALDACLATFHNINALREHVPDTVRMHGIITEGGLAANIVPERAVAQFSLRAKTLSYMTELSEKVKNCARAGALATGAKLEISNYEPSYFDMITNKKLQAQLNKNLNALGITEIKPGIEGPYSTDVGNVSHACPSIHNDFNIYAPGEERFPTHTPEFREATIRPFALEAMKTNILGLVMTAWDVIEDSDLLTEIQTEFKKATAAERG